MGVNYSRDTIYVGGQWIKPHSTDKLEVISPYTEEVIATVPKVSRDDVDTAVAAARNAFDHGPWH